MKKAPKIDVRRTAVVRRQQQQHGDSHLSSSIAQPGDRASITSITSYASAMQELEAYGLPMDGELRHVNWYIMQVLKVLKVRWLYLILCVCIMYLYLYHVFVCIMYCMCIVLCIVLYCIMYCIQSMGAVHREMYRISYV